jgi:PAS domain S-box-containing protein
MIEFLRRLIAPPVFEDENKTHQAYLLNIILWTLICVPFPYVLYAVIFMPQSTERVLTQGVIGEAVNIFLLILLKRGHVRLASVLQVIAFWLFITGSAYTGIGVQGEAYLLGYPLVIVITGLLLGGRYAFGVTGASLLSGLGMVYAVQNEFIDTNLERPLLFIWIVSMVIFPLGAVLQYLSSRTVKRALERAQLSEEKYRLILDVGFNYIFESVVDSKGNVKLISVGGAFEKMTGYTPEEYISRGGWYAHIHPDDLEKDAEDMRKLLGNQDVVNSEIRTIAKNGEIRWERIFARPVWSTKENRLTGIIGAVQDITEQKKAEARLNETLLQQSAILDNIPDMAWLKDLDNRYIAVNEQYLRISGMPETKIIGKTDYEIWDKEFADRYRKDDLEVIQSGQRRHIEEFQRDHTGREYWVETIKTPIRNAQGDVIGTIGIAREITERKKAELEREKLIAELEAKNAELERFTYTVSHDLKSPLVTITGFLNYLEKDARAGDFDKFQKDLTRIRQAVDKMQALLRDLLELSRIGRLMHDPVEIGFGEIVCEALEMTAGQIKARGVRIEFEDEGHKIRGDRVRLVEVLQNLVDNAVKFMGDQQNPLVRIGAIPNQNGKPTFFVQDNGIGINQKFSERIFGLFNKLDTNTPGSGIGLTLVKRIVEVHGGQIWVESEPGKGSTFYFTLS